MRPHDDRDLKGAPPLRRPETSVLVKEALRKDANDVDALFVLAALRAQDGHPDEGLTILDRVLVIDPGYPGAWFFKEKIHRMRGEARAADSPRPVREAAAG